MAQKDGGKPPHTTLAGQALRKGISFARNAADRQITIGGYSPGEIQRIMGKPGFVRGAVSVAIFRLATRSVPGALLVGGGLVAKALYDRRRKRRHSKEDVEEAGK